MALVKSNTDELYTAILGNTNNGHADAVITLGGKSPIKFVPNINAAKWDDEFFININNKKVIVTSEKQTDVDSKIDLVVGNDCHRYYIDTNGDLEYEIIFSSQPKSSEILFDLKCSKGLEFYQQPALTEDEIAKGCIRPENVVGSYAVYCNKANNKYQTGKVCHIYRPFLIDAKGNVSWCTLFVDPSAGVIQIIMDEKWLAAANYPVMLDPTFGYTTVGGTLSWNVNCIRTGYFAASESGTLTSITAYVIVELANKNCKSKMALYNSTREFLRGMAEKTLNRSTTSPAWETYDILTPQSITAAYYHFAFWAQVGEGSSYSGLYWDSGGTSNINSSVPYISGDNDWPASLDLDTENKKMSIYATYELPASGGGSVMGGSILRSPIMGGMVLR